MQVVLEKKLLQGLANPSHSPSTRQPSWLVQLNSDRTLQSLARPVHRRSGVRGAASTAGRAPPSCIEGPGAPPSHPPVETRRQSAASVKIERNMRSSE
jgi:hypothetical protein